MVFSEEVEKEILKQHHEVCKSLNLDKNASSEAWKIFSKMYDSFIPEGEPIHWLGCAIYAACRGTSTPAVGKSSVMVEGNLVNLARLLKLINLSLVEFIVKIKRWAEFMHIKDGFLKKIYHLERNFTVSIVVFKKYQPIFTDMFSDPGVETSRSLKSKKYKIQQPSIWRIFEFTWTLFVCVKSRYPKISDDLVSSYHLLLACCDLIFVNILVSERTELINDRFPNGGLRSADHDMPSVIDTLCERHNGIPVDTKAIKEYQLKSHIRMLFDKRVLKGNSQNLMEILDSSNFDHNVKGINKSYEEYVLSAGDFDERIFLGDFKKFLGAGDIQEKSLIGCSIATMNSKGGQGSDLQEKLSAAIAEQLDSKRLKNTKAGSLPKSKAYPPITPLTGKLYLDKKEVLSMDLPAVYGLSKLAVLQNIVAGRQPKASEFVLGITRSSKVLPDIEKSINDMTEELCTNLSTDYQEYGKCSQETINVMKDLIKKLYYKLLDPILEIEIKKSTFDVNHLLKQDIFHKTLFCCGAEIVLFSHNCLKSFQWILKIIGITPYHFYRIIEIVVRSESSLTRELVKHLNEIEETILESLAWQKDSPLWRGIIGCGPIPSCEDVSLNSVQDGELGSSEMGEKQVNQNNAVDKLALLADKEGVLTHSPGGPLSDRFTSPKGKRPSDTVPDTPPAKIPCSPKLSASPPIAPKDVNKKTKENRKPKRTGAMALFFRKFYYLASVRILDICDKLELTDADLRKKIWTCFELSVINHVGLMADRHLDQILMCAVYVICKIVGPEKSFYDIVTCYRNQPQAQSGVYRNVLVAPNKTLEDLRSDESSNQEKEERADLIKFYNTVYVQCVKEMVLRFKNTTLEQRVVLSPIPVSKSPPHPRKVTENFALFLKTQSQEKFNETSGSHQITYSFKHSPAKELQAINKMVKLDASRAKRILQSDDDTNINKSGSCVVSRRVQGLREDRRLQKMKLN